MCTLSRKDCFVFAEQCLLDLSSKSIDRRAFGVALGRNGISKLTIWDVLPLIVNKNVSKKRKVSPTSAASIFGITR